jgi:hypothetical protein
MNQYKEIKSKLDRLHRIQWDKKQQLRKVIKHQAEAQRTINLNEDLKSSIPYFYRLARSVSDITKDLNARRREISMLESQVWTIKNTISKDAYFQLPEQSTIFGLHAVGFKDGPDGGFFQEDIWANNYVKGEDGILKMKGGSMRVHGPFDVVVQDLIADGAIRVEGRLK